MKLKLLLTLTIGIMASSSGMIQVKAVDYIYNVDFSTKTVANFNDFKQSFIGTTTNLELKVEWAFNTFYKMNACPPSVATNSYLVVNYQINGTGTITDFLNVELPDMPCTVGNTFYQITGEAFLPSNLLDAVVDDDVNFIAFRPNIGFRYNASAPARIITLEDAEFVFSLNYDFDTTYLFNYFLSDSQFASLSSTAGVTLPVTRIYDFDYVLTTAGNDRYFIINSVLTNFGTTRTKFAIDYNSEFFRGESIGARHKIILDDITTVNLTSTNQVIVPRINYYYLNTANNAQAIVDAPEFDFEYEDCGSFLALNVGCFINNGLAYLTNDAPIISDAITLINAGIALAAQTFGIIGNFADDNIFGYLILASFGFIAVKWLLKND